LGPKSKEETESRRTSSSASLSPGGGHSYHLTSLAAGCTLGNLNICVTGPFLTCFGQTNQPNSHDASSARCSRTEHAEEDRLALLGMDGDPGACPASRPAGRSARQARAPP